MKKQKDVLHCIAIAFIFFTTISILAACSERKRIIKEQSSYYPYDLFVPDFIITVSFGY